MIIIIDFIDLFSTLFVFVLLCFVLFPEMNFRLSLRLHLKQQLSHFTAVI